MDYQKFYNEIVSWIMTVNQKAVSLGMDSQDFWNWVMESAGWFEKQYPNNQLVVKQMVMLIEWLEEVYNEQKKTRKK